MDRNEFIKDYFYLDESPISHRFLIKTDLDLVPCVILTEGSYGILPARILGLTYAEYCRMCRDLFSATLSGKNNYYVVVSFKLKEQAELLVKILNQRMALIMMKRKLPLTDEWEERYQLECSKARKENNLYE